MLNPEVASAQWVPLDDLMQPGGYHLVKLEVAGQMREVQAYQPRRCGGLGHDRAGPY